MNRIDPSSKIIRSSSGFSLIEVVLALSIIAVGLITIMGLFPQGLNSAKNAADDSLCAMVAQDTIADRRIDIQTGAGTVGVSPVPPLNHRWFTANGVEIINPSSATGAMFCCQISASLVPGFQNLEETRVQIFWPWYDSSLGPNKASGAAPANTNTFITQVTKY